ncbi:MAG: aldo/keto reductase [Acidobacteriota bacterium]
MSFSPRKGESSLRRRREFLKNLAFVGAALIPGFSGSQRGEKPGELRKKKGEMWYRRLGRTNLEISEITLGGSPLPDWSLFREIIDRGVNYVDTSCTYSNGNSERQIGRLFKEVGRDKVYVATKFHLRGKWTTESIIQSVEGSLRRLETDFLDVLSIHGADRDEDLVDERVLGAFERLKKQGKFRYNGLSCHSNHHKVLKTAVECGQYDMIQPGYNVFEIDEGEKGIRTYEDYLTESGLRRLLRQAASRDVGIIAMKTLKVGGRRQNLERYGTGVTSLFQAMLKWVLENEDVTAAVTEMLNRRQMEEDLAAAGSPLTPEERRTLFRYVAENCRDYCRQCGRCQRGCPSRVATTEILRFLAYYESYGKTEQARALYSDLSPDQTALACLDCGLCESSCPFGLSVRSQILRAHGVLFC